MFIEELDEFRVACHVNRKDLKENGVSVDDITDRTQLGMMFIRKCSVLSKSSTEYAWPGCGFSMEIKFGEEDLILIFSERVDDFIYNLKQNAAILPAEQQTGFLKMIEVMEQATENEARAMIYRFENAIRDEK